MNKFFIAQHMREKCKLDSCLCPTKPVKISSEKGRNNIWRVKFRQVANWHKINYNRRTQANNFFEPKLKHSSKKRGMENLKYLEVKGECKVRNIIR